VHSRSVRLVVFALVVGVSLSIGAVAVGTAAEIPDNEINETQTVTAGPQQGAVDVDVGYRIGDDIERLEVRIADSSFETVATRGFRDVSGQFRTYEWDQQSPEPTLTLRTDVNKTSRRFDGLDFVDAGDWLLTDRAAPTDVRWWALNPERIELHRTLSVGEQGVAGNRMSYLGGYDDARFAGDGERFRVVVTEDADPDWTVDEIGRRLLETSDRLDVGARAEPLTVFAVTDPLRRGGLTVGPNADIWVHDATLTEQQVALYHEYVHSRQAYNWTDAVAWTAEGGAEYYGLLLALKDGAIEYHRFAEQLERGNDHGGVVLSDRASWRGTVADYELGALTLATLDAEIRARSAASFEEVFRSKNARETTVTAEAFESAVSDAAGTGMGGFFDRHIRSTPPRMSAPGPTVYDGPNEGAALRLGASDLDLEPGESGTLTVDIENTGNETSLAPELALDAPSAADVEFRSAGASGVTRTDRGWVLDHLAPGQHHTVEFRVESERTDTSQLDLTVEDLSGQRASGSTTLDSRPPLEATLDVPDRPEVSESVDITVETSLPAGDIAAYRYEIAGPDGDEQVETGNASLSFEPSGAGEYAVRVGVTAVDGRNVTATGAFTIQAAETGADENGTDRETTRDDGTEPASSGGEREAESAADGADRDGSVAKDGSDDGSGDGFGPATAAVAVLLATLVARYRLER